MRRRTGSGSCVASIVMVLVDNSPTARFAEPLTAVELGSGENPQAVIVARAQELLAGVRAGIHLYPRS